MKDEREVAVIGTRARGTLNDSMYAWSNFNGVFSSRANVVGGMSFVHAPWSNRVVAASESAVAIMLAMGALGEIIELEVEFQSEGVGEGRQAGSLRDFLYLGAGDGDDDRRGRFSFPTFIGGEPVGFLG
jgi:hypothetical protein